MSDNRIPKLDGGSYHPLGQVVRAEELARWSEANHILENAREQAERIIERAEEQAILIRQRAERDGMQSGMDRMLAQVATNAELVNGTVKQLSRALPDLVIGCLEKIIGRLTPEELTRAVVEKTVGHLHSRGRLKLQVAPNEQEMVQAWILDHARQRGLDRTLFEVKSNPELGPGDLLVETAVGLLDATLDTQINKLKQALNQNMEEGRDYAA